jgi:hypothetical protein
MIEIRTFLNADLPYLADLWCIHHATYRNPPAVNHAIFQQAIASRLFFDFSRLLVATHNGHPVAWCQWFPGENKVATLAALCFQTDAIANSAVVELLRQVEHRALLAGMVELSVGIHFQSTWGYQGLEPIGHGLGIDVADDRTNTLLESSGYQEIKRIDRWEVLTTGYRPPVNRELLMLRRSAKVQRDKSSAQKPGYAAAMIHLEIERHVLVDLITRAELASVELWTSDPEAFVMPSTDAIIGSWSHPSHTNQVNGDDIPLRYLVANLIAQLAERRIRSLHRSVATDNIDEATTLIATNFTRTSAGRLMMKKL